MTSNRKAVRRRSRRGFSLIELGIVIAVIAVLAAVVVFGRGFILAARVTKAVDASNSVRKAASTFAGLNGGALSGIANPTASQLATLAARGLIAPLPAGQTTWTVSGAVGSTDAIVMTDVRLGQLAGAGSTGTGNAVLIRFTTPTPAMAQDILTAVKDDKNIIANGNIGGQACQVPTTPVTQVNVSICFFL
jgi:prepilin-type N-terminal cleavage/methylation domain-containing protein